MDQEGFATAVHSVDEGRTATRREQVRCEGPRPDPDSAESPGTRTVRGVQQRAHLPREGAGIAELLALSAPGRLGCAEGRRQGPRESLLTAGGNRPPGRLLRRALAVRKSNTSPTRQRGIL